jgi:hypothetical protein
MNSTMNRAKVLAMTLRKAVEDLTEGHVYSGKPGAAVASIEAVAEDLEEQAKGTEPTTETTA